MITMMRRIREYDIASKAAILSVTSNAALMVLKLAAALMFGSVALLGDGVDSAEDLVRLPRSCSSRFVSPSSPPMKRIRTAMAKRRASRRFFAEDPEIYVWPSLVAVGITAVINLVVASYAFRASRLSGSVAVASDAKHLLTNVVQALAIGVGLALVGITGNHLWDPIFALLLAAYLVWIATGILRSALHELLDSSLPEETLAEIQRCLDMPRAGLRGYHALRTRKSGRETHIDMHLLVDPGMSVSDAHTLSEAIETDLRNHVAGALVSAHIDPDEPGIMDNDTGLSLGADVHSHH